MPDQPAVRRPITVMLKDFFSEVSSFMAQTPMIEGEPAVSLLMSGIPRQSAPVSEPRAHPLVSARTVAKEMAAGIVAVATQTANFLDRPTNAVRPLAELLVGAEPSTPDHNQPG